MTESTPTPETAPQPEADDLATLDRELEKLIAEEEVTLQSATDSFLDALIAELDGVREEDLVQVTLTQHGTVTIYTRDRAQRRRNIRLFKRDEVDAQ